MVGRDDYRIAFEQGSEHQVRTILNYLLSKVEIEWYDSKGDSENYLIKDMDYLCAYLSDTLGNKKSYLETYLRSLLGDGFITVVDNETRIAKWFPLVIEKDGKAVICFPNDFKFPLQVLEVNGKEMVCCDIDYKFRRGISVSRGWRHDNEYTETEYFGVHVQKMLTIENATEECSGTAAITDAEHLKVLALMQDNISLVKEVLSFRAMKSCSELGIVTANQAALKLYSIIKSSLA